MSTAGAWVLSVPDASRQEALGGALARACAEHNPLIFLAGDLGAGKTTLTRGFLRQLGHRGAVKSPTFTLIEPYEIGDHRVMHLDLYRVRGAEELEYLGLRELLADAVTVLIEWPGNAGAYLPAADVSITIEHLAEGRRVTIAAPTELGREILSALRKDFQ